MDRRHTSAAHRTTSAWALCALAGCTSPATAVEVGLDTDVPRERSLAISAHVAFGAGAADHAWTRAQGDAGGIALPASFTIAPPPGAALDPTVELTIDATIGGATASDPTVTIRRVARFRFEPHVTQRLPVFLALRCAAHATGCAHTDDADCTQSALCEDTGRTCGDTGTCVDPAVVPQRAAPDPSGGWLADAFTRSDDAAPEPMDVVAMDAAVDADAGSDAAIDAAPDATPDAATDADAGPCVFTDDFSASTMPSFWGTFENPPPATTFARTGGELVIGPAANATMAAYSGYYTNAPVNMSSGAVSVEVVQTTDTSGPAETVFEITDQHMNAEMGVVYGQLSFRLWNFGHTMPADSTQIAYDPVAHHYWRMRAAAGMIHWETSPDGASWTERRAAASPLDLTMISATLTAGTFGSDPAPGAAHFDNFRFEHVCP